MNRTRIHRAALVGSSTAFLLVVLMGSQLAAAAPCPAGTLDSGFAQMYELRFSKARACFNAYIREHPRNPMGEAALAASYLFEEFNKQGILTSSFFLNNKKLLGGVPNPGRDSQQVAFIRTDQQARDMAKTLLKANPRDPDGLFVLTLANGMMADYDALIAKEDIASLSLLHQTQQTANLLLKVNPHADDAYLALGAANYIIGCLPGYKRFFLSFAGIHGSRKLGMQQLQIASDKGHYLKPFAKVLLAMAALREKQPHLAHTLLAELHQQFPENPDFANELAKLNRNGEPAALPR